MFYYIVFLLSFVWLSLAFDVGEMKDGSHYLKYN